MSSFLVDNPYNRTVSAVSDGDGSSIFQSDVDQDSTRFEVNCAIFAIPDVKLD